MILIHEVIDYFPQRYISIGIDVKYIQELLNTLIISVAFVCNKAATQEKPEAKMRSFGNEIFSFSRFSASTD